MEPVAGISFSFTPKIPTTVYFVCGLSSSAQKDGHDYETVQFGVNSMDADLDSHFRVWESGADINTVGNVKQTDTVEVLVNYSGKFG